MLRTCSSNTLDAGHKVAAWNALCALIDQTIDSQYENVRLILWQAEIWNRGLRLYLDHSHNARPKSSKQLLASLSNVLRKSEGATWIGDLKDQLSIHVVGAVSAKEVHRDSKAYLLLLTHVLSKNIITLDVVLSQMTVINQSTEPKNQVQNLLCSVFRWTTRGDFGSIIGQLTAVILDKLEKAPSTQISSTTPESANASVPIWSAPLHETLGQNIENTEAYRSHIFPVLFKRSLPQYAAFLQQLGLKQLFSSGQNPGNENTQEMLYAALQTGKSLGLIEETTGDDIVLETNRLLVPIQFIAILISSDDRNARLAGLSLFIASLSPTRPFHTSVLEQLKQSLSHLHADTDAFFRSELFSLTQRMFDRMRAATAHLAKAKSLDAQASLQDHKNFIDWYIRFLAWELRPTSSYQRHISALKCLALLLRSGVDGSIAQDNLSKSASGNGQWPFEMTVVDAGLHRLLLDLLMDPYDDVRQTSAGILELCNSRASASPLATSGDFDSTKERAIAMMLSSGRADHADGVAYLHSLSYVLAGSPENRHTVLSALLDKTEEMLRVADDDLAKAVEKFPLHGLLTSLRYVFLRGDFTADMYPGLHDRVQALLQHVWKVVRPTLCDDAPEGHMPDEMDDVPDISSKDILSYCWRSLKEASLLLGTMLSPAILKTCSSPDFKPSMFELCFTQLAELRHRGAFSTVAQTWTTCCSLMESNDSPLGLSTWYERTIGLLQRSLTINTRRSAGLPSLLCGILIADRSGFLFKRAFAEFEQIAREVVDSDHAQEGSLPQVHAMNCMKDVLKNTRLAEKSEQYVPIALRLAADSLRSEAWAIRNCGLMLFRAVIDRLLGTNDAYVEDEVATKRRVDFEHHHDLLELVIGLLSTEPASTLPGEGARNEGVFPALQLLQRAQMPESKRIEVQTAVFALTSSPSWHVRDKAARTFASFVPIETTDATVEPLLAGPSSDHNALHGSLLCATYLIRRLKAKISPLDTFVPEYGRLAAVAERCKELVAAAEWLRTDESCLYTSIAFVDVEDSMRALEAVLSREQRAKAKIPHFTVGSSITLEGDRAGQVVSGIGHLSESQAIEQLSTQTASDRWLEQRAEHLEHQVSLTNTIDAIFLSALEEWAKATQSALKDNSMFSTQAAVNALSSLNQTWPQLAQIPSAGPLLRLLCFSIYDLLNDDDEDIRLAAAHSACRIFNADGGQNTPLVPLVTAQKLADLMARRWPDAADLFEVAVERAFGGLEQNVGDQLDTFEKGGHALFAEEKQNLYVDEARETRVWADVARRMVVSAVQGKMLDAVAWWAVEGVYTLRAKFETSVDGPLGWSSNDDAFLLGLRVVHAARVVVLRYAAQGVEASVDIAGLKNGLNVLLEAAKARGGNVLWVREIEGAVAECSQQ